MKQKMRWRLGARLMLALTVVLTGACVLTFGMGKAKAGVANVKSTVFRQNFDNFLNDSEGWKNDKTWFLTGGNVGYYLIVDYQARETSTIISPTCDLRRNGVPVLSLAYKNPLENGTTIVALSVCYRVNEGEWQKLFQTDMPSEDWVEVNLYLPDEVKQENVEFGFIADSRDRFSSNKLCLDDISLFMVESAPTHVVSYNANNGSGSMTDSERAYDNNATLSVRGNGFTAPEGMVFDSWNTEADGSGTTYHKGDFFNVTESVTLYAQWAERATVLKEGFENGFSDNGWTTKNEYYFYSWSTSEGGHSSGTSAELWVGSDEDLYSWLITPTYDLSGSGRALLSFWYANPPRDGYGELTVCYSVDGGEWQEILKTENGTSYWTWKTIALPEEAMRENVRIGFKGVCKYQRLIYLDDVLLEIVESIPECVVTYSANGTTESMTDPRGPYVYGTEKVTVLANEFERPEGKYFFSWNTEPDGSGTSYDAGDTFMITGSVTLYAQWRDLLTSLEEDFESKTSGEAWKLDSDSNTYRWVIGNENYYSDNRCAYAVCYDDDISDGTTSCLITPPFDFSGGKEPRLSFKYYNPTSYPEWDALTVCYRVNGGEWQELFKTEDYADDWTKQVFYLPEAAKQAYVEIGFRSIYHAADGAYLDDVSVQMDDFVRELTVTYDANGGTVGMMDPVSHYLVGATCLIMPNKFHAPDGMKFKVWNTKQDGSGTDYYPNASFEITENLTLYAQWTEKQCLLDEDFEAGTIPQGWSVLTENSPYPWKIALDPDSHSGRNLACVYEYTEDNEGVTWLITPALDLRNDKAKYVLKFWYANPAYFDGYYFNLSVHYRVNGGEWQEIFHTDEEYFDWTLQEIILPDEAMAENVEIGFMSTENCAYGIYLDDVTVSEERIDELELKFRHNIEFDNNIAMHYVFKKSELKGCSDLKLVINKEVYEKNVATPTITQYVLENPTTYVIEDEEYWHFTFPGIAAPEMGNVLEAQLIFRKDGFKCMSKKEVYSVMQYAYDRLDETKQESYRSLLVDMLNYGASAQMHFGINTGNLVNAKLTKEQEELATPFFGEVELMNFIELSDATAFFNGTNVLFDNKVMLLFGLDFTELLANLPSDTTVEKKMENVYVKFSWEGLNGVKTQTVLYSEFKIIGDRLAACCDMLAPAEMGCMVNATIYDGNTPISGTIQCSIEAYATDRLFATTSSTYKKLMIDMIVYGKSVNKHFSTVVTK